jgi:hypothetical protein
MSEVKQEGEFKIKKRKSPKKLVGKDEIAKVDLSQPKQEEEVTKVVIDEQPKKETDAIRLDSTDASNDTVGQPKDAQDSEEVVEQVRGTNGDEPIEENVRPEEEVAVIQEITEEEVQEETQKLESNVEQAIESQKQTGMELPENIQKVVDFMNETGGTLQDYVRLNADYSSVDNQTLLREYYKQTKPYLEGEDINLLLEDFSYDEELDEERDIRKKKIAYKEEVAKAKNFLEGLKSKYYDEIKLRPGVTQDQQKAMDFFNRYKEEQKANEQVRESFLRDTNNYFSNEFKGFDFKVGEKKFRYSVKDTQSVMNNQNDLTKVVGKFLNDEGKVKNYSEYHKALFAARNADTIAQHFYEQGKADAVRDITAKSNNISADVRQTAPGDVFVNGIKVKAVNGIDSSRLKIKTLNKN